MDDTIAAVKALDIDPEVRDRLVSQLEVHDDELGKLQCRVDELEDKLDAWECGFTGKEAEELRTGIEKAMEKLEGIEPCGGYDCADRVEDTVDDLRRLLDKVDARDSLRFLETLEGKLGAIYHAHWSQWVNELFEKATYNEDGSMTLPREVITRWSRHVALLWPEMTHKEQAEARKAAAKFLVVLRG